MGIGNPRLRRLGGRQCCVDDLGVGAQNLLEFVESLLKLTSVAGAQARLLPLLVLAVSTVAAAPTTRRLAAVTFDLQHARTRSVYRQLCVFLKHLGRTFLCLHSSHLGILFSWSAIRLFLASGSGQSPAEGWSTCMMSSSGEGVKGQGAMITKKLNEAGDGKTRDSTTRRGAEGGDISPFSAFGRRREWYKRECMNVG